MEHSEQANITLKQIHQSPLVASKHIYYSPLVHSEQIYQSPLVPSKLSKPLRLNFCYLEKLIWDILLLLCWYSSIICVCFNEIIWLIRVQMWLKVENSSNRYGINRTRSRYGYEYSMIVNIKYFSVWWRLYAFSNT